MKLGKKGLSLLIALTMVISLALPLGNRTGGGGTPDADGVRFYGEPGCFVDQQRRNHQKDGKRSGD